MNVKAIGICAPSGASNNPVVTPELLASCLAKYSRSNKGIESILQSIDWSDSDKAVDSIFKFVDYGHASITGMTGGIAIVIDGLSMYLAYKIFEFAQLCDGQESSTRYIKLDHSNVSSPLDVGIPQDCIDDWNDFIKLSFTIYQEMYTKLDEEIKQNPSIIQYPKNANEKIISRIQKNYALDRARYFIPFATKTNAAFVMTARVWTEVIKQLSSLPNIEAKTCASKLIVELEKFTPRMIKHCYPDDASFFQSSQLFENAINHIKNNDLNISNLKDEVFVTINNDYSEFLPELQTLKNAFNLKQNRYSTTGTFVKRQMIRVAWNNMSIAELRDLNRHRSGYRFSPLVPVGFYYPKNVFHNKYRLLIDELLKKQKDLIKKIANSYENASYVYCLLLGTQVQFEHSTHLDKFIYEIELRTGMGAHFRYAEHLNKAYEKLIDIEPGLVDYINIGTGEPE